MIQLVTLFTTHGVKTPNYQLTLRLYLKAKDVHDANM